MCRRGSWTPELQSLKEVHERGREPLILMGLKSPERRETEEGMEMAEGEERKRRESSDPLADVCSRGR